MLKNRIIPCLDVKNGRVVKGINFVELKDAGDPVEQAKIYSNSGADEICFLDITASNENRETIIDIVRKTAKNCFVPLTVGGGVRTIQNIKTLDFLKEVNNYGISRLIYTDINRDGTKESPNFEETIKIADISNCPVIISGGVSSMKDIKKAKELNNKNIEGIIIGKAIYDGDIKLDELAKEINA